MKRICLLVVALVFVFSSVCYGQNFNNWGNTDTIPVLSREFPYDGIYLNRDRGGTSAMASGTTVIPLSYGYVTKAVNSGKTVNTLADGYVGQVTTIMVTSLSNSGTCIVTPATCTGFTTITLDANYEYATLMFYSPTLGWVIVATNGTIA